MKKLFSFAMLFAALSFALVSCKEEDKPATGGETGGTTGGTTEVTVDPANYMNDIYSLSPMAGNIDKLDEVTKAMENKGWESQGYLDDYACYDFAIEYSEDHPFMTVSYYEQDGSIEAMTQFNQGTFSGETKQADPVQYATAVAELYGFEGAQDLTEAAQQQMPQYEILGAIGALNSRGMQVICMIVSLNGAELVDFAISEAE